MSALFVRPNILHRASSVLSATSERGLTTAPPEAAAANAGQLRLRASGVPTAVLDAVVRLQTGGNPTGYVVPGVVGRGRGAAAIWRHAGDAGTLYRGYSDTPNLVRVAHPVAYSATTGVPSTPRELPDGYLGVLVSASTTVHRFYRIAADWSSSSVTLGSLGIPSITYRSDFVVLPSGRLVAYINVAGAEGVIDAYFSDDYGLTWAALGQSRPGGDAISREILCAEAVDDAVVLIQASASAAIASKILISLDGGATFVVVDTASVFDDPRTCVHDGLVIVGGRVASLYRVQPIAPGGGAGDLVSTTASSWGTGCVVRRDDGTLWAFGWEAAGAGFLEMDASVSLDGGLTWSDPLNGRRIMDFEGAAYGTAGFESFSAGSWRGAVVVVARTTSAGATDNALHFLQFGEWATVTDGRGGASLTYPYEHTYIAIDLPENLGWPRTVFGGGAVATFANWLNIASTAVANSSWASAPSWWSTTAGTDATRKVRLRVRVNSGGSLADNRSCVEMSTDDGANSQPVLFRFSTAGVRCVDFAGVQVGLGDLTATMTSWTDILIAIANPSVAAANGRVSAWYRQDASAAWTTWLSNEIVPEQAGVVTDLLRFGGLVGGAADWDIAYIGAAEHDDNMAGGFANPSALSPRPLTAAADYYLASGLRLGARNAGGVPADTYAVRTGYQLSRANVWRELRPSRRVESSQDNSTWDWRADSGPLDLFRGDVVGLFGTNVRQAAFELHSSDAWGAPAVSVTLDATVYSGTRLDSGPGWLAVAGTPRWRHGQWASDGDAHRWFVEVTVAGVTTVHELADNDESRVYVDGIDLGGVTGVVYVFGDRMGAVVGFCKYRFMRVAVSVRDTADGHYRLGTVIFDEAFRPEKRYDETYTDRVEPNVVSFAADSGSVARARLGPRRYSVGISWGPLNSGGPFGDVERRIRDFYSSIEGNLKPIVFWRDPADVATLQLVYVEGAYAAPNVRREGDDAIARVDELQLVECT